MSKYLVLLLVSVTGIAQAQSLCSTTWYQSVEKVLHTADTQGHGSDLGSNEWKSVIEFKLGVRDRPDVPERSSEQWCQYVDQQISEMWATEGRMRKLLIVNESPDPSYECTKVKPSGIEAKICEDKALSALDRKLSAVYASVSTKAGNEHAPRLKAEQRGWIKGRNDCWKSNDVAACLRMEYQFRIAELQARHRLVAGTGPIYYECDGNSANEITAMFFETDPPTLIAERSDSVSLMYQQPSVSGIKYVGPNESLWEHQTETIIIWGYGAPEELCKRKP
ncbi:MliC family protein [Pseudomonas sp. Irchel s3h9]|uniref:MliC family protein n=1 Tax=Pseudomonas sp. Irchel s3h9 TaxID=2009192 RepID=UPI000BA33E2C|nr:MliC family protein [Pseudomonas sp. Irchel s3h9]